MGAPSLLEPVRPYSLGPTPKRDQYAKQEERGWVRRGDGKGEPGLMGHASSAYMLDLYAAYVPSTGIGLGGRYMGFLRAAGQGSARGDSLK